MFNTNNIGAFIAGLAGGVAGRLTYTALSGYRPETMTDQVMLFLLGFTIFFGLWSGQYIRPVSRNHLYLSIATGVETIVLTAFLARFFLRIPPVGIWLGIETGLGVLAFYIMMRANQCRWYGYAESFVLLGFPAIASALLTFESDNRWVSALACLVLFAVVCFGFPTLGFHIMDKYKDK